MSARREAACPGSAALALFITGAASPAEAAAVESHVDRCTRCALRLSEEAQLEVKLWSLGRAVAADQRREDVGARLGRLLPHGRAGRLALFLAAATVVLAVVPRPVPAPAPSIHEPDEEAPHWSIEADPLSLPVRVAPAVHELPSGRDHRLGGAARRGGAFVNYHGAMGSFPHFELSSPGRRRRPRAILNDLEGDVREPTDWPVSLSP